VVGFGLKGIELVVVVVVVVAACFMVRTSFPISTRVCFLGYHFSCRVDPQAPRPAVLQPSVPPNTFPVYHRSRNRVGAANQSLPLPNKTTEFKGSKVEGR